MVKPQRGVAVYTQAKAEITKLLIDSTQTIINLVGNVISHLTNNSQLVSSLFNLLVQHLNGNLLANIQSLATNLIQQLTQNIH